MARASATRRNGDFEADLPGLQGIPNPAEVHRAEPGNSARLAVVELLEPRLLLSASWEGLAVEQLTWNGYETQAVTGQYVVRFSHGEVKTSEIAQGLTAAGFAGATVDNLGGGEHAVISAAGYSLGDLQSWADSVGEVVAIEPNFVQSFQALPGDGNFSRLWGLNNTGQTGGSADSDIDAPEAWNITTGSSDVVIAIIDTGVDYRHNDLAANMWRNSGEIAGDGKDNDGNGYVDDVYGYDFANNDGNPMDGNGHGTHVAGTIGAAANGSGVVGVNWDVSLMALKFLTDSGYGSTSDAIAAINYATMMKRDFGVNIVATNNSWGGGGYSSVLRNAIAAAGNQGILFIAAAGNDNNNNDQSASYPSNYNLDAIIAVAATDHRDNRASFSSYGATTVDLAAPGVSIYSTTPNNRYASYSGTSMATPHVSGVVGLLAAANPSASMAEIKQAILDGADPVASMAGKALTGGRLNAHASLQLIDAGDLTGPTVTDVTPAAVGGPVGEILVTFNEAIDPATVRGVAFSLVEAGADGVFGSGDDQSVTISSSMLSQPTAESVQITFSSDLTEGSYRLVVEGDSWRAIKDLAGNALGGGADETYAFQIIEVRQEVEANGILKAAEDSGLDGVGSVTILGSVGFRIDIDIFSFVAARGQTVVADLDRTDSDGRFIVRLFNQHGRELTFSEAGDDDQTLQWELTKSGTYYVAVSGHGNYRYTPWNGKRRRGERGDYVLNLSVQPTGASQQTSPDGFGRRATTTAYTFEDIRSFGTPLIVGDADDVSQLAATTSADGFKFSHYGQQVSEIHVATNGFITFERGEVDYYNTNLATYLTEAAISPLWDDMYLDADQGVIYTALLGGGKNQRLIVQWSDVRFYGGSGQGTVTFQAILYERDGSIRINYQDLAVDSYHSEGGSATVGIKGYGQGGSRDDLLLVSFNDSSSGFVGTGKSLRISGGAQAAAKRSLPAAPDAAPVEADVQAARNEALAVVAMEAETPGDSGRMGAGVAATGHGEATARATSPVMNRPVAAGLWEIEPTALGGSGGVASSAASLVNLLDGDDVDVLAVL